MTTKNTRFQPGRSGNPSGRKPGSGRVAQFRKAIEEHVPQIVEVLVRKALDGDSQAARLLLERALPPIKAVDSPAPIALPDGSLSDQARAVIAAAGRGTVTPNQAAQLLTGLGAVAKIIETDELERRIAALEGKTEGIGT